ncbi:speriolin-like protein isoform X1 [Fukomys damarensis]|uniref:speriolin-like protein isoform X1 n=1 Tax=Fukomys damarensis TaxID=885580 RepID=UPI00053F7470|nr:speriolin-like protein isoform X1 [Fukomys damarensis]
MEGRAAVELWSWLFLWAVGSRFPPLWGCRSVREHPRAAMAEGSELMNRLMSENADLKKQVRLLKENQMLKRLLSENRQDGGRGARDLLFPKTPPYPEACSPGSGGPDFGRFASVSDTSSQLPLSSLEDLLCSHAPLSSEDEASLGCMTSSQLPFKSFLSPPELRTRGDRKLSPLLSPLQDPLADKALLEPREMLRPKKVCFSEGNPPAEDRTRRSYYLNGTACTEIQSFASAEKDSRIVGEIAFQLDRRILAYVFPCVTRLYGFTVSNIPEKIKQTSIKSLDGSVDEKKLRELTHRYLTLTARLEKLGYSREVHPVFSEFLINTYGILKQRPDLRANPLHSSPAALRKLVIDIVPPKFLGDSLLLLNCLCELAKEDSKPLFAW